MATQLSHTALAPYTFCMDGRAIFTDDSMKAGRKDVNADIARTILLVGSGGGAWTVIIGNTLFPLDWSLENTIYNAFSTE